jgi:hypothetical protein
VMQPLGHRGPSVGRHFAVGDMAQSRAFAPHDPPAGATQRGVEAEDDQPSFSIAASETS